MSGAAVLRFSRDRRGYEHFYLVQPERQGKGPARILYWFRTPPGIKVGRAPFDDELKRQIEAQNPGVTFDWPRLLATPIPPPPVEQERWRERRQVERAEKAARAARRADRGGDDGEEIGPEEARSEETGPPAVEETSSVGVEAPVGVEDTRPLTRPPEAKRRRRRRRRGRGGHGAPAAPAGEQPPPPGRPDSSNE